jgi:hypothetical protein
MAFDGGYGANQYWSTNYSVTGWLKLYIGSTGKILGSYALRCSSAQQVTRFPKDWTMEGSDDNSTWNVLHTITSSTAWSQGELRTFTCDVADTEYKYFRLNISANNGTGSYDPFTQVGEVNLYELYYGIELTYPNLSISGTGFCYLITGGVTYPISTLSGTGFLPITAAGGLSIPLFSTAGLVSCLLITGGLSFTFELTGSGRNINGQGGPTLPRFSQSLTGMITYDQGGLAYRMTLAAAGVVSMPGSGGLALPMFSLLGEAYEHNQTLSNEEYLRRSLNDTVGLSLDQNPVTPTYIEPADNATTDYLKNFLGVGH